MKEEDGEVGCEILELLIPEAEVGLPLPLLKQPLIRLNFRKEVYGQ
jgi:hypothetical protein